MLNEPALTSPTAPQDPVGDATGEIPNAPGTEPALAETVSRPEAFAAQAQGSEGQPCGDLALLAPLKKSPEYRVIRRRGAKPRAIDSWQEDGLHFFVFELRAAEGAAEPPMAVFTMHPAEAAPVSVVVVTPSPDGEKAEVLDLRQPASAYSAPLPP